MDVSGVGGTGTITFMLTWSCDIRCEHCCQDHRRDFLPAARVIEVVKALHADGLVTRLSLTGGEPFIRYDDLVQITRQAACLRVPSAIVTNALWCHSEEVARHKLGQLSANGLDLLVVSYDSYHAAFVPMARVTHLLSVAAILGIETIVYATIGDAEARSETERLISELTRRTGVRVVRRRLVPVGYARNCEAPSLAVPFHELDTACPIRQLCTVWPDGRVFPCCTAGTHPNLCVGNLRTDPIREIVVRLRTSLLLRTIWQEGPGAVMAQLPDATRARLLRRRYVSACHLCYAVMDEQGTSDVPAHISQQDDVLVGRIVRDAALASQSQRLSSKPKFPVRIRTIVDGAMLPVVNGGTESCGRAIHGARETVGCEYGE